MNLRLYTNIMLIIKAVKVFIINLNFFFTTLKGEKMNKKEKLFLIGNLHTNHINKANSEAIARNTNIINIFFGCGLINSELYTICYDLVKTNRYFDLCTAQEKLCNAFNIPIIY